MARKTLQWRYKLKKPRLDNPPDKIKQLWKHGMRAQAAAHEAGLHHGLHCMCHQCIYEDAELSEHSRD